MEEEKKVNRDLCSIYTKSLPAAIDEDGDISPWPCMINTQNDELLMIASQADPDDTVKAVFHIAYENQGREIIVGVDRRVRPEHGLTLQFSSVFTFLYWNLDTNEQRVGIFPYSSKQSYGEVDWNNEYWNNRMRKEITGVLRRMKEELESQTPSKS